MKHQRKVNIDATRGGFELPTNSKTANIGTFSFSMNNPSSYGYCQS